MNRFAATADTSFALPAQAGAMLSVVGAVVRVVVVVRACAAGMSEVR